MELMVIKTIAGFMNAVGGTLLIGVADDGKVVGIEKDIKTLGSKQSRDGFALWLTGLLDSTLGPAATSNATVNFEESRRWRRVSRRRPAGPKTNLRSRK